MKTTKCQCPFCGNIANRDNERIHDNKMQGYNCRQCGDFVLSREVDAILCNTLPSAYVVHDFDVNILKKAVQHYFRTVQHKDNKIKTKSTWFCISKDDYEFDDGRIYIDIKELYNDFFASELKP